MTLSAGGRVSLAGAAVVGVAFGMARYAYGLTLPGIRQDLGLSELVLGTALVLNREMRARGQG